MPVLTVFAGPNGSGKSSIIRRGEFEGKLNLLEADAIAKRMNPALPEQAAISAGREVLLRAKRYLLGGESFSIETTLAGAWTSAVVRSALESGFFVRLIYVCVDSAERSIQRVRERVARGGHDVPDRDIRRRYVRSLVNARRVLRVVHEALVFDNTGEKPELVLELREGHAISRAETLRNWVLGIL